MASIRWGQCLHTMRSLKKLNAAAGTSYTRWAQVIHALVGENNPPGFEELPVAQEPQKNKPPSRGAPDAGRGHTGTQSVSPYEHEVKE